MEQKSKFKLFFYAIVIALLLMGIFRLIVGTSNLIYNLEIGGLLFLLFLSFIGLFNFNKNWGERVLFFVFLFYLSNEILIWIFFGVKSWILIFLTIVGFLVSFPKKEEYFYHSPKPEIYPQNEEIHSMVFDPKEEKNDNLPKVEVYNDVPKVNENSSNNSNGLSFNSGNYLASKRSSYYHELKCDIAKKFKKSSKIWFESKEEALEKGYKAHDCVK